MTQPTGTTRRRWPLVLVIAVLAIAVVAGTTAFFARRDTGTAAPAPSPTATGQQSPGPSSPGDVQGGRTTLANGCLGGADPAKAILTAHQQAPLTAKGAAAFAATYMRWVGQIPHARDDAATVGPQVWAPEIPKYMTRIADLPSVPVTRVMIGPARYRVDKVTKDTVTLALLTQSQSTTEQGVETQWGVGRVELRAVDGHWRIAGGEPLPRGAIDQLRDEGLPFKGGC